ncbi:MAG: hypothetical protein ACLTDV_08845 [Eubacterium sp.]
MAGILAIIDQKPGGISKDFTYGSVDCHYGTGTVSVPGNLQSGGDVFEYTSPRPGVWLLQFLIIVALPLGLIFARILTDRTFRYCT